MKAIQIIDNKLANFFSQWAAEWSKFFNFLIPQRHGYEVKFQDKIPQHDWTRDEDMQIMIIIDSEYRICQ